MCIVCVCVCTHNMGGHNTTGLMWQCWGVGTVSYFSIIFWKSMQAKWMRQPLCLTHVVYNYASIWNSSCLMQCHIIIGAIHRCLHLTVHKFLLPCLSSCPKWVGTNLSSRGLRLHCFNQVHLSGNVFCVIGIATLTSTDCSERCPQKISRNAGKYCTCQFCYYK